MPKRKFSRELHFLVGICPRWAQQLGVQNTVLLLGLEHRHSKHWGATAGQPQQALVLDRQGCWGMRGSCAARAVYDEVDFTAALLRGARCHPGREFPSSLDKDDRQQLHRLAGPCASRASSPLRALRGSMLLRVRLRTALGPRPPESTIGSARSAQQEEILGRVGLWSRTNLS